MVDIQDNIHTTSCWKSSLFLPQTSRLLVFHPAMLAKFGGRMQPLSLPFRRMMSTLHLKPFLSWLLNSVFKGSWLPLQPNSCINIYVEWIQLMLQKLMDDRPCRWSPGVRTHLKEAPSYRFFSFSFLCAVWKVAATPEWSLCKLHWQQSTQRKVNLPRSLVWWKS